MDQHVKLSRRVALGLVASISLLLTSVSPVAAETLPVDPYPEIASYNVGADVEPWNIGVSADGQWAFYASEVNGFAGTTATVTLKRLDGTEIREFHIDQPWTSIEVSYLSDDASQFLYSNEYGTFIHDTLIGSEEVVGGAGSLGWEIWGNGERIIISDDWDTFSVVDVATGTTRWNFAGPIDFLSDTEVIKYSLTSLPNGDDAISGVVTSFVTGETKTYNDWDLCEYEVLTCDRERQKSWSTEKFFPTVSVSGMIIDYFLQAQWDSADGSVTAELADGVLTIRDASARVESKPISYAESLDELIHAYNYTEEDAKVARLYQAYFGRTPDVQGLAYWIGEGHKGATLDEIAYWFSQSQEFKNAFEGTTNDDYVAKVYSNVLGRDYDQSGYNYWLGLLNDESLDRSGIVYWVTANDEFIVAYPFLP